MIEQDCPHPDEVTYECYSCGEATPNGFAGGRCAACSVEQRYAAALLKVLTEPREL